MSVYLRVPTVVFTCILSIILTSATRISQAIEAGFGVVDITPELTSQRPVWLAGYGQNRRATSVHDPIYARAVVLRDGDQKIAMVVADVVGIFYPTVLEVRERLPGFSYVMVSATHSHEGPDTMGLWGPSPIKSGVDPEYMKQLVDGCVKAVLDADANATKAKAQFGTASNDMLLADTRQPTAFDSVLRTLQFISNEDRSTTGIVLQWNCHPESMGSRNTEITADFLYETIKQLENKYKCPVVAFTGAVGGLMAPPRKVIKNDKGEILGEGDFEYCRLYGEAVGKLAIDAAESAKAIELTPIKVSAKVISLPMDNPIYRLGAMMGLIKRDVHSWSGDFRNPGEKVDIPRAKASVALASEVVYLQLGQLHVAGIPGEIYPELVYGSYQEPADPNVDFPDVPLEKPLVQLLPSDKFMMIGLANDEVGYIIPKRQWDDLPPFAYDRKSKQYGEVNSIGPETAPIIMQALGECISQVPQVTLSK